MYLALYKNSSTPRTEEAAGPVFEVNSVFVRRGWEMVLDISKEQQEEVAFETYDDCIWYDGQPYHSWYVGNDITEEEKERVIPLDPEAMNV